MHRQRVNVYLIMVKSGAWLLDEAQERSACCCKLSSCA
jgi:hypothetical protein